MDIERFDAIVKELSTGASRRRVLAGALLGSLLTHPPFGAMHDALAKDKKKKKKKKKKRQPTCDGGCGSCQQCVNGQCQSIPPRPCYGCQDPVCVGNDWICVETGVGRPCGELCCEYSETCCNEIPGASYCSVATPPCAACQTLCSKPDGDLCCSSTQVCCKGNTPQAQCKSIFEGC